MRQFIVIFANILAAAATANAAPARRLALVVGDNRGDAGDQPLRFAEADAARVARVLRELGGFAKEDVVELRTPDAAAVRLAMEALAARAADETRAGRPPLLLFYYSGHADQDALHLAGGHLALADLRRWLDAAPAAVRLAVLDSCRSGALTRVKGAHQAPAIEVRLTDELTTRGEALLTSATSDEQARESDGLRGSFFTHHLVTGLRGAADRSRDGRVTLAEAYDYAYAHTVAEASGGQHPTFKYDLAGRGEVVLTSLQEAGAWLSFPSGTDGFYLILGDDGLVLGDVEVGKTPLKVAIAPGRYQVRKRTSAGDFAVAITVGPGEERWVHDNELAQVPIYWQTPSKGSDVAPAPPPEDVSLSADGERRKGITEVAAGAANLVPTGALEGSIFAFNRVDATYVLAPLSVIGVVVTSALLADGGFHLREARAIAREGSLGSAARYRRNGLWMMTGGLAALVAGALIGTVGATLITDPAHASSGTALMVLGWLPASVGLGVLSSGLAVYLHGRGADGVTVAPVALRGGGGFALSYTF